jgi:hypothetical protein
MRFDIHLRENVRQQLSDISSRMATWERDSTSSPDVYEHLVQAIQPFSQITTAENVFVGGVDGSGEFPVVAYGDSFVYATVSVATLYRSDSVYGLREVPTSISSLVEFTWLTTTAQQRTAALFESFERLAGYSIEEVILGSDYSELHRGARADIRSIRNGLIVPPAHDAGNVGVQLRTTAELAAALRLIDGAPRGAIVLTDGTMTLPFVHRTQQSLFFEHLRRFCCVRARERGVIFAALSKSHGLPSGIRLEDAAREKLGDHPEHWYLKLPDRERDGWSPVPADGPFIPPVGAISYLVRLQRTSPIMRLDLDARRFEGRVELPLTEQNLFEAIDYASHDQRCFGYPYPIKAAHDRASLTQQERAALRKQVIDAAVGAGLRRTLFRDAAQATRHA